MKQGNEKYIKTVELLRKSKPVLDSTEDIEREVIREISRAKQPVLNLSGIIDFLFGWIYVEWVRRSLITASVVLVLAFVYQQGVILRQINFLSSQIIVSAEKTAFSGDQHFEKLLLMYKRSDRGFPSRRISISEKQMEELIESVNELQTKYKDLEKLIEDDPELKMLIEKKLRENNRTKAKL